MANEPTQAASSPAEQDPFNGLEPTHAEFSKWRETGELGERFKPAGSADAAPADNQEKTDSEATTESAGESETPKPEETQEHSRKPKNAEQRIAQLEAAIEAEWSKDEPDVVRIGQLNATIDKINGRPKRKSEIATPATPAAEPQPTQQKPADPNWTRPKPTPTGINQDGKPYETYEDYVEDLADWKSDQKIAQLERQQAEQQARTLARARMDEARTHYEDADETIIPVDTALGKANIPPVVKQIMGESDVYLHMCYLLGTGDGEYEKFIALAQNNTRAAIGKIYQWERDIKEELAKNPSGTAPEKKKTQAPPPPTPVSGSSGRAFDVNDDSISDDEWMRKRRKQVESR